MSTKQETGSLISRSSDYVSESFDELRKVSKPSRQETMQFTIISLVIVVFVSICIMVLDLIFDRIMSAVLI
ncbi:MAG: preprotein translocase subunit SecE [Bdellovibrionales bacterium]|nr:preprotein translocase subunit SecE [Bdellovibrionales bacterium]